VALRSYSRPRLPVRIRLFSERPQNRRPYGDRRSDKIHYETSSGTLTLPKSIVDHIEKGGGYLPGSPAQAEAGLAITPPALELLGIASAGNQIESGAVHDGSVDRAFIAKLKAMHVRAAAPRERAPRWRITWPRAIRIGARRHGPRAYR